MIHKDITIVSIVEDDLNIGSTLKKSINSLDAYVCDNHYMDCTSALVGIPSCQPSVVIMDIGLPDMSGVDCMKQLLKNNSEIKFIMFTVFDTDELLFEALRTGASGYILKDDSFEDIHNAINEVLRGGAPMSPAIALKVVNSFKITEPKQNLKKLTDHQKHILELVSEGLLNKEIASELKVTEGTIKNQIRTIYKKLQVNNRVEASSIYKDS